MLTDLPWNEEYADLFSEAADNLWIDLQLSVGILYIQYIAENCEFMILSCHDFVLIPSLCSFQFGEIFSELPGFISFDIIAFR